MTRVVSRIPRLQTLFVAVLLAGCGPAPSVSPSPSTAALTTPGASPTATVVPTPTPTPTDLRVAADLDGLLVEPQLAHRLPLAISIDDARVARPQSGFNATSLFYHAPVDGYETRYLLVFQESDAADIGPTRSARLYLAQWAAEYRAALGHYGGDRITREWIQANKGSLFTNVDGIGLGNPAYHRISTRRSPYNAYTTSEAFRSVAERLGGATVIDPSAYLRSFREDAPGSGHPDSHSVTIPYKTVTVGYTYDRSINAYRRTLDGVPHVDAMDGREVLVRTVVILFMPFRTDPTIERGHSRPVLAFAGTGEALIIAEGRSLVATWSKRDERSPTILVDADGRELPFIRGRIAFQIVPSRSREDVVVD